MRPCGGTGELRVQNVVNVAGTTSQLERVMDNEVLGHLFLSYSHTDKPYMLMFRKHLGGMLLNKNVQVWSDQDISKGTGWESFLMGNGAQASSALVLATPDYLISPWCRLELKQLAAASRAGNLR